MEAVEERRATAVAISGVLEGSSVSIRAAVEAAAATLHGYPFGAELSEGDLPLLRVCAHHAAAACLPDDVELRVMCDESNNSRSALSDGEVTMALWVVRGRSVGHASLTRVVL